LEFPGRYSENEKPLDPKEVVTVQELATSTMLEIGALRKLLLGKGIISNDIFVAKLKKLDRDMKEKRKRKPLFSPIPKR
jgi:hypothetical protein